MSLTPGGLQTKRLRDIIDSIRQRAEGLYGQPIEARPSSVIYQLFGVVSQSIAEVWSSIQESYDAFNPDTAQGAALENLCAIVGVTRLSATPAVANDLLLSGDPGVTVPSGTLVGGTFRGVDYQFELQEDVTLDGSGESSDGIWEAAVSREVFLPSGVITNVITPVIGLASVAQPTDIIGGSDNETDEELRERRNQSVGAIGAGTDYAILGRVLQLDFLRAVRVISNRTLSTDGDGRPPKSFEVIVWPTGGVPPLVSADEQELVTVIFATQPAGIESFGSEEFTVTDPNGYSQPVAFSYASPVDVYVTVTLNITASRYAGDTAVRDAILSMANDYTIGQSVFSSDFICGITDLAGVNGATVELGNGGYDTLSSVAIGSREIATFDSANINIVVP